MVPGLIFSHLRKKLVSAGLFYYVLYVSSAVLIQPVALAQANEKDQAAQSVALTRCTYVSLSTCLSLETAFPYNPITLTDTFYSNDPDHMCWRIYFQNVYQNLNYAPLITVKLLLF